jgi:hypothetical protein
MGQMIKNLWNNSGTFAKGIVASTSAVVTALIPAYGGQTWFVGLAAGVGALNTIMVVNQKRQP